MTRDQLFRKAVAALDAGDVEVLRQLLAEHPDLAATRLDEPGAWLKQQAGAALAAVKCLVEAGGDLARCDTLYQATPRDWALHSARQVKDAAAARPYRAIADFLEARTATS